MLKSIRHKLVLAIFLVSLLPAIPLAILFQDLTGNLLDLTLDRKAELAFNDAIDMVRTLIQRDKNAALKNTRSLAENPDFLKLIRRLRLNQVSREALHAAHRNPYLAGTSLDRILVFDSQARILFDHENIGGLNPFRNVDSTFVLDRIQIGSDFAQYVESESILISSTPLLLPNLEQGLLVSIMAVNPEFARKTATLLSALHHYQSLDDERPRLQTSFLLAFLSIYFVVAIVSIAASIVLSMLMIRPIKTLMRGTERIAAGNWDYQIPVPSGAEEFRQLADSFNTMVTKIREEKERALQLEKMAAWREIAQRLAHEIKNPLTPIQLMAQQIKDSYHGADQVYRDRLEECCEIIDEEIENLRNLTREFSEFARLPVIVTRPSNLNDVIKDIAGLYSDQRIILDLDEAAPPVEIDTEAVRRVLLNLVDNGLTAILHRKDGQVHLQTSFSKGVLRLKVTDNGQGISRANLGKIFEPHFSTKKASMGLGLAIVKSILNEHRASVQVESVENLGTTFTIDFHQTMPTLLAMS